MSPSRALMVADRALVVAKRMLARLFGPMWPEPREVFERRWALTVLERVLARLRVEWSKARKEQRFEELKVYITGDGRTAPYREIATRLEMTEGAVKAAVRRLRQRFGELLRQEITDTVASPAEVTDEVRHLLSVITPWTKAEA